MADNKKYFGIRFPFTAKEDEKFFIDIESNPYLELKSDIMHMLFTPTGQRLRNPSFGTNLIKYIFEPMDSKTYTDIKNELQERINKYFPGVVILELTVTDSKDEKRQADVSIKYQFDEGSYMTFDTIDITI